MVPATEYCGERESEDKEESVIAKELDEPAELGNYDGVPVVGEDLPRDAIPRDIIVARFLVSYRVVVSPCLEALWSNTDDPMSGVATAFGSMEDDDFSLVDVTSRNDDKTVVNVNRRRHAVREDVRDANGGGGWCND